MYLFQIFFPQCIYSSKIELHYGHNFITCLLLTAYYKHLSVTKWKHVKHTVFIYLFFYFAELCLKLKKSNEQVAQVPTDCNIMDSRTYTDEQGLGSDLR